MEKTSESLLAVAKDGQLVSNPCVKCGWLLCIHRNRKLLESKEVDRILSKKEYIGLDDKIVYDAVLIILRK